MKILSKDNYFEDPDLIRKIALSVNDYRVNNDLTEPSTGWRGKRSFPLREMNDPFLNDIDERILKDCSDFFNLENYIHPLGGFYQFSKEPVKDLVITTYFHMIFGYNKKSFIDFYQDRFHKDGYTIIAGVIYLNPDAPLTAGTTVLDGENNQMINVENKYNRLVAYEGYRIHAPSDVFGNNDNDGRLTLSFFIHEPKYTDNFD